MGLDFCSAPASSVDAERVFSEGRREVNFMQHNMAAQTFRAEMALGSWDEKPFFPSIPDLVDTLKRRMNSKNGGN
ncbi:hypothetical protein B0H13DRAFT_1587421 [Mycena leptocephala]|nr:hypothetical protein B0H13DRAFT_1587421 [Mycena leptocephala]